MRWQFWRRRRTFDFSAEMAALQRSMELPEYPDIQRVKDFKAVFGGPAGQRVLFQLMTWASFLGPAPAEPNALLHIEGRRYLCYQILAMLYGLPVEPEATTEEDEEKDHVGSY